jgi:hypothetical protein
VSKGAFAGVFGRAFLRAFDKDTVQAAFEATGIYPFNPDVITEKQMKPSLPKSTKGDFPLPQPSPVRRVMAVFRSRPPTAFDVSPDAPGSPESPSRPKHSHDPDIDPNLYTPTKRMQLLHSSLGASSSGSFLVSKA